MHSTIVDLVVVVAPRNLVRNVKKIICQVLIEKYLIIGMAAEIFLLRILKDSPDSVDDIAAIVQERTSMWIYDRCFSL